MPSHAIVTESGQERRVVQRLADQGISAYCPTTRRKRYTRQRTSVVELPIFPRYVFVHTLTPAEDFATIRHTAHVSAILCVANTDLPAPISDTWLAQFLLIQTFGGFDYARDRTSRLRIGQAVRIISGQFHDYLGTLTEFRGARALVVTPHAGKLIVAMPQLQAA